MAEYCTKSSMMADKANNLKRAGEFLMTQTIEKLKEIITDFENIASALDLIASNVKYYNTKTGQEAIYESNKDNAKLVTSVDNIGTFNYFPPNNALWHIICDVLPYWLRGNSNNDTTPVGNRMAAN